MQPHGERRDRVRRRLRQRERGLDPHAVADPHRAPQRRRHEDRHPLRRGLGTQRHRLRRAEHRGQREHYADHHPPGVHAELRGADAGEPERLHHHPGGGGLPARPLPDGGRAQGLPAPRRQGRDLSDIAESLGLRGLHHDREERDRHAGADHLQRGLDRGAGRKDPDGAGDGPGLLRAVGVHRLGRGGLLQRGDCGLWHRGLRAGLQQGAGDVQRPKGHHPVRGDGQGL